MDSDYFSLTPSGSSSQKRNTEPKSAAGTILRVKMVNFMCHANFVIDLNDRINFIIGKNGSGKSAIQTAIAIGLGGKALGTNRGTSLKNLIMNGKSSCTIIITLSNEGSPGSFKPDVYGSKIIVERHFSHTSGGYKISGADGRKKSTEKKELDRITSHFNIQVSNPICILHQDVARCFLNVDDDKKKFQFYLKASRLHDINDLYSDSKARVIDLKTNVDHQFEVVGENFDDVREMEKKREVMKEAEKKQRQCGILENELAWAKVNEMEFQLKDLEKKKQAACIEKDNFEKHLNELEGRTLEVQLRELEVKIAQIDNSVQDAKDKLRPAKQDWTRKKEDLANKKVELSEVHRNQKIMKRKYDSCIAEIENNKTSGPEQKLRQENLKKEVEECVSTIRSISAAQENFEMDKQRFQDTMDKNNDKLRRLNEQITDLQQKKRQREDQVRQLTRSSSSLTVYGNVMMSIVEEVNRAHEQGKFQKKPIGPIGAHIKVRKPEWAGPVEHFLNKNFLSSFCVDNKRDLEVLKNIFNRVCNRNKASQPTIFCSKFIQTVHNYAPYEANHSQFMNLARALDVDNPVVMNCIIDNQEPETILLIDQNEFAYDLLDEAHKVPRNCKRAFTLTGDTFYAAPNYKSYSSFGDVSRATLLQTNQEALIRQLKEAISSLTQEITKLEHARKSILEQQKGMQLSMRNNEAELSKLRQQKHSQQQKIHEKNALLEAESDDNMDFLIEESKVLEVQLNDFSQKFKAASAEYSRLQNEASEAEKIHEELQNTIAESDKEKAPIQGEIQRIRSAIQQASTRVDVLKHRLNEIEKNVDKLNTEIYGRLEELTQNTQNASQHGDRIRTKRKTEEIQRELNSIRNYLKKIEDENGGTLEVFEERYNERMAEYNKVLSDLNSVQETALRIHRTIKERRHTEFQMKIVLSNAIKTHFCTNLAQRDFEGKLEFDFLKETLKLNVKPLKDDKTKKVETVSLSGGEKSFATVCFLLALWQESQLPFHFLDEFDVFMDGINRRTAVDLLITFAKNNPRQFVFLTPLDLSSVKMTDIISVQRMPEPERGVASTSS